MSSQSDQVKIKWVVVPLQSTPWNVGKYIPDSARSNIRSGLWRRQFCQNLRHQKIAKSGAWNIFRSCWKSERGLWFCTDGGFWCSIENNYRKNILIYNFQWRFRTYVCSLGCNHAGKKPLITSDNGVVVSSIPNFRYISKQFWKWSGRWI